MMMDEEKREQELRDFERWYKKIKGIPLGLPVNYGSIEARNMWIAWQGRARLISKQEREEYVDSNINHSS